VTACSPGIASVASPASPSGYGFDGVDWSRHVRTCSVDSGGSGLGTVIADVVSADVTGDGHDDYLVIDECESSTSPWPQQIEVFDGASPRDDPVRLAVLLADDPLNPRDLAVSVGDDGRVTVTGTGLSADAPLCCPDLTVRRAFQWSGQQFTMVDSAQSPS
jgi:hypothetical protein